MNENARLCPRCLQTLRLMQSSDGSFNLFYLCSSCGWSTDDEFSLRPRDFVSPFDLPRYVQAMHDHRDEDRPHAAGE